MHSFLCVVMISFMDIFLGSGNISNNSLFLYLNRNDISRISYNDIMLKIQEKILISFLCLLLSRPTSAASSSWHFLLLSSSWIGCLFLSSGSDHVRKAWKLFSRKWRGKKVILQHYGILGQWEKIQTHNFIINLQPLKVQLWFFAIGCL